MQKSVWLSQKVRQKTMLYWATKVQISVKWRLLTCLCLLDSFSPLRLVLNITVWEGNFLMVLWTRLCAITEIEIHQSKMFGDPQNPCWFQSAPVLLYQCPEWWTQSSIKALTMKFTRVQLESKVEQQFTIFRLFTKSEQPIFPLYPTPSKSIHNR